MNFPLKSTLKALGLFALVFTAVTASNLVTDSVDRRTEREQLRVRETCLVLKDAEFVNPESIESLCSEYLSLDELAVLRSR